MKKRKNRSMSPNLDDKIMQELATILKRMIAESVKHARENSLESYSEEETIKRLVAGESIPFYPPSDSIVPSEEYGDGSLRALQSDLIKRLSDHPAMVRYDPARLRSLVDQITELAAKVGEQRPMFQSLLPGVIRGITSETLAHFTKDSGDDVRALHREVGDLMVDYISNATPHLSTAPTKKDAFICHSSEDKEFVERIAGDIIKEGYRIWYSDWELKVGDSLIERIQSAIEEVHFFMIVLSKSSVVSNWVQRELRGAYALEDEKGGVFILPLLCEDCEIPTFLKDKFWADCRGSSYENGLKQILNRLRDVLIIKD